MRIIYFIDGMRGGGAAKKTTMIANELAHRGNDVSIVTDTNLDITFDLEDGVKILPLYEGQCSKGFRIIKVLKKLKRVRNIVKSVGPDVVISVLPHVSFYVKLSLIGMSVPVIFSDETSFARKDSSFVHFIRHHFYNFADSVVVLTENDVKLLGNNIPQKIAIHNPVVCPEFNGAYESKEKTILAIGPLKEWEIKGFDLLFNAFASLAVSFTDWNIVIVGNDREPYKTKVIDMAKEFGISDRVCILGFRTDIFDIMRSASIFALSSRIEGFSLSLIEAMSQGCACVAFEIYGVIEEVTSGGKGVLMVKDCDVEAYSDQLRKLMESPEERIRLAEEGRTVVSLYGLDKIVTQWEELFIRLCNNNR